MANLNQKGKYIVANSNEEVTVLENKKGQLSAVYTQDLLNGKYFWFSRTERFFCIINKPDKDYILMIVDLLAKSVVRFGFRNGGFYLIGLRVEFGEQNQR